MKSSINIFLIIELADLNDTVHVHVTVHVGGQPRSLTGGWRWWEMGGGGGGI